MRIIKNKAFNKWAKKQKIDDSALVTITKEMELGLYEANLGSSIYKKRLPMIGRGKRGGGRVVVAFKIRQRIFFIYGFSKNQTENITDKEKEALKVLAELYFAYSESQLDDAIKSGKLVEVAYEKIYS